MSTSTEAPPARRRHAWMLLSLIPIGFGTWVPIVAGLRARRPLWTVIGMVICGLAVAGLFLSSINPEDEDDSLAGMLLVVPWIAAAAMTFAIYPSYRRRRAIIEDVEDSEQLSERRRLVHEQEFSRREHERERAPLRPHGPARGARARRRPARRRGRRPLRADRRQPRAAEDPPDAAGRRRGPRAPDRRDARERFGRFSSIADLGFVLDLDPDATARLERVAIAIDA